MADLAKPPADPCSNGPPAIAKATPRFAPPPGRHPVHSEYPSAEAAVSPFSSVLPGSRSSGSRSASPADPQAFAVWLLAAAKLHPHGLLLRRDRPCTPLRLPASPDSST